MTGNALLEKGDELHLAQSEIIPCFGQVNKESERRSAIYQRHYASKKVRFLAIVKGGPSLASSDRGAETRNDDDEGKDDSAEKRPKIF